MERSLKPWSSRIPSPSVVTPEFKAEIVELKARQLILRKVAKDFGLGETVAARIHQPQTYADVPRLLSAAFPDT